MSDLHEHYFPIVIIGGGVLGNALSYALSSVYSGSDIAVIEMAHDVACHASGRNTGVIHRPFYLHPEHKKKFALMANESFVLWKKYAKLKSLPWKEIGTLEVATSPEQRHSLDQYQQWAIKNGMEKKEIELLSSDEVRKIEPHVHSSGALFCQTDTAVDFRLFTQSLKNDSMSQGVTFFFDSEVKHISNQNNRYSLSCDNGLRIETKYFINCAGGGALKLAHMLGLAREFADMHFRGDYWHIHPSFFSLASRNIYSVPRHSAFPFLDPHWVVKHDGSVEIGPNAAPIIGPYTYSGVMGNPFSSIQNIFTGPFSNRLKLLKNKEFYSLALQEWRSSFSRRHMIRRVQAFLPELDAHAVTKKGIGGIRSILIDPLGNFVKEALEFFTPSSLHILNYNSPGATGAPFYALSLISQLKEKGFLEHLSLLKKKNSETWSIQTIHL
ncbi:FAD-dependent oxidoreductase [Candidatus Peregrinibacteria bacterium]|nr:FAD-dependent oxidoreductase [Candidatus Peregrinibacteria bacterium]